MRKTRGAEQTAEIIRRQVEEYRRRGYVVVETDPEKGWARVMRRADKDGKRWRPLI